jgi:hypothetical protein
LGVEVAQWGLGVSVACHREGPCCESGVSLEQRHPGVDDRTGQRSSVPYVG